MRRNLHSSVFLSLSLGTALVLGWWHALPGSDLSTLAKPGLLAEWDSRLGIGSEPSSHSPRREIAGTGERCLKDRLGGAALRADIARFERERGGRAVPGLWGHLDTAKLPAPQGAFLNFAGGSWTYKQDLDFTSCSDLPCVLNTIYGTPEGDPGYHIYGWYLRTGYLLSTVPAVPRITFPDTVERKAYLFTPEELTAFWRLAWTLSDSFRYLPSLQTIHRLPKGWRFGGEDSEACGIAWGHSTMGDIRLTDDCLHLGREVDSSVFYPLTTHEMAHRLDSHRSRLSETNEWRELSGWYIDEVITDQKYTDGSVRKVTVRQWRNKADQPEYDAFVRGYAGTSPSEDFADSLGWFRYRTAEMKGDRFKRKREWIAEKFFSGRTYDPAGLLAYYRDFALRHVNSALVQEITRCTIEPEKVVAGATPGAAVAELKARLNPVFPDVFRECVSVAVNRQLGRAFDDLRANEYEACDLIDGGELGLRRQVSELLLENIEKISAQQGALAAILKASQKLRAALAAEVDPREAYLNCLERADAQECFAKAIDDAFNAVGEPYRASLGDTMAVEAKTFKESFPYDRVAATVASYFRVLLAGIDPSLRTLAVSHWNQCLQNPAAKSEPGAAVPLSLSPFDGGERYVSAAFLSCINGDLAQKVGAKRDGFLGRLGLQMTDGPARRLVDRMLMPVVLEELRIKLQVDAVAEDREREKVRPEVVREVQEKMGADLGWLGKSLTRQAAVDRCHESALRLFSGSAELIARVPTNFAAIEDIQTAWVREACAALAETSAVRSGIDRAVAEEWQLSMSELERFVVEGSIEAGDQCFRRYGTAAAYYDRRNCTFRRWESIEATALEAWGKTQRGRFFQGRRAEAREHLIAARALLLDESMGRVEKRAEERRKAQDLAQADITAKLLADSAWVSDSIDAREATRRCVYKAQGLITAYAAGLSPESRSSGLFAREEDRTASSEAICDRVVRESAIVSMIQGNHDALWARTVAELEEAAADIAKKLVLKCAQKYKGPGWTKPRQSCAFGKWNRDVEQPALKRWANTDLGSRFVGERAAAAAHLTQERTRLQTQARGELPGSTR